MFDELNELLALFWLAPKVVASELIIGLFGLLVLVLLLIVFNVVNVMLLSIVLVDVKYDSEELQSNKIGPFGLELTSDPSPDDWFIELQEMEVVE